MLYETIIPPPPTKHKKDYSLNKPKGSKVQNLKQSIPFSSTHQKLKATTNTIRLNTYKLIDDLNNTNSKVSSSSMNNNYLEMSYEKSGVNIHPDPLPIKHIDSSDIFTNSSLDNRLSFTLVTLGLGHLLNEFTKNLITFNDLLMLSKEDLEELKLPFGPRNRILKFAQLYKKSAKAYNFDELKEFFANNRNLVIKDVNEIEYKQIETKRDSERLLFGCDNMSEIKKNELEIEDHIIIDKSIGDNNYITLNSPSHNTEMFSYVQMNEGKSQLPAKLTNIEVPEISSIDLLKEEEINHSPPKSVKKPKTSRQLLKEFSTSSSTKKSHSINKLSINPKRKTINKTIKEKNFKQKHQINLCNKTKKEKIFLEYKNIFSEISDYQKNYNNMKQRSDERNIRINNLLLKANHNDNLKKIILELNNNKLPKKQNNELCDSEFRSSLSNKNKFTISKSDANDIENLNEMLNLEKIKSYNA